MRGSVKECKNVDDIEISHKLVDSGRTVAQFSVIVFPLYVRRLLGSVQHLTEFFLFKGLQESAKIWITSINR